MTTLDASVLSAVFGGERSINMTKRERRVATAALKQDLRACVYAAQKIGPSAVDACVAAWGNKAMDVAPDAPSSFKLPRL